MSVFLHKASCISFFLIQLGQALFPPGSIFPTFDLFCSTFVYIFSVWFQYYFWFSFLFFLLEADWWNNPQRFQSEKLIMKLKVFKTCTPRYYSYLSVDLYSFNLKFKELSIQQYIILSASFPLSTPRVCTPTGVLKRF